MHHKVKAYHHNDVLPLLKQRYKTSYPKQNIKENVIFFLFPFSIRHCLEFNVVDPGIKCRIS